jgi:hypothetical protein
MSVRYRRIPRVRLRETFVAVTSSQGNTDPSTTRTDFRWRQSSKERCRYDVFRVVDIGSHSQGVMVDAVAMQIEDDGEGAAAHSQVMQSKLQTLLLAIPLLELSASESALHERSGQSVSLSCARQFSLMPAVCPITVSEEDVSTEYLPLISSFATWPI